jgi:hypothetical protein
MHFTIFPKKYRNRLKILGASAVLRVKVRPDESQILDLTVKNVFATAAWRLEFVYPWPL